MFLLLTAEWDKYIQYIRSHSQYSKYGLLFKETTLQFKHRTWLHKLPSQIFNAVNESYFLSEVRHVK